MSKHMPQDEDNAAYHYAVVKRAIDVIDAQNGEALSLEELARKMQMSPAHFQRVFSKWVGVSPKRYQQYLTLGHAKALLDANFTTLGTADAVGLSGAGRLHDLFVRWEAMSPGEFALKGAGLTIRYGYAPSPFGEVVIMATDRGICGMGFTSEMGEATCYSDLANRWPKASFTRDDAHAVTLAQRVFAHDEPTQLHLIGAPFQIKVWEALLSIPSGQVSTYSEIAGHIGTPKAVRAVGTAVGRNPISWLVPCHRALRKSGGLGGYHWGLPVKRAMLAYEGARADAMRQAS